MTEFDQGLFLREMDELLQLARRRLDAVVPAVWVYTLGIYIETGRRESSIHVEDREHSDAHVAALRAWFASLEARYPGASSDIPGLAEANRRFPSRNINMANFRLTNLAEAKHHSFRVDPQNYDKDEVALWRALDPALERVAMTARDIFGDVLLDPEAEIAINTRDSDYGRTWPLRPPAT